MNLALIEKQRADAIAYVKKQTELCKYVNDPKNAVNNYQLQIGRPFTSLEFEQRLKKLNRNLLFEDHPYKIDKKCLYHIDSRGKHLVSVYERGFMCEHSVLASKEEEIWDQDFVRTRYVGGLPVNHINKADLPKSEFVPGKGLVWDSNTTPGYKKVEIPWHEAFRGWRTVLLYIISRSLATPYEVESIFGSDNTAQWKKHTKKGYAETIF